MPCSPWQLPRFRRHRHRQCGRFEHLQYARRPGGLWCVRSGSKDGLGGFRRDGRRFRPALADREKTGQPRTQGRCSVPVCVRALSELALQVDLRKAARVCVNFQGHSRCIKVNFQFSNFVRCKITRENDIIFSMHIDNIALE